MNVNKVALLFFWLSGSCAGTVKAGGARRDRRQACAHGMYRLGKLECCNCPTGYYVTQHCSNSSQNSLCKQCDNGTFMAHPNFGTSCEACKDCQSERNLEVEKQCTANSNTVCRCMHGYFCDKGEECFSCYTCETCEGSKVKVHCTSTNNTVCDEKQESHGIVIAVIVTFGVVVIGIVVFLWKKGFLKRSAQKPKKPEEIELLPDDVALRPYLSQIATVLKLQVVKALTRRSLEEAEIEKHEHNNPNNAEEVTYKLLEAWYQKHGERGACNALIKALNEQGRNSDASRVREIINEKRNITP